MQLMGDNDALYHDALPALEPLHTPSRANESVVLYEGQIQARDNKHTIAGDGQVAFSWHPSRRITVQIEAPSLPPEAFEFYMEVTLVNSRITIRAEMFEVEIQASQRAGIRSRYYGTVLPTVFVRSRDDPPESNNLSSIVFHVTNFPRMGATETIQDKDGRRRLGRVTLDAHVWRFTFDELASYRENAKQLNRFGGFAITHVGKIECVRDELFSRSSAAQLLKRLSFYLSYLRGHWSSLILPAGFNIAGQDMYSEWYAGEQVTNWREPEALGRSVSLGVDTRGLHRFLELADDPVWGEAIMSAIQRCALLSRAKT